MPSIAISRKPGTTASADVSPTSAVTARSAPIRAQIGRARIASPIEGRRSSRITEPTSSSSTPA